jgi:CubicO group peptidase (beta-lactamase class C family)
MRYAICLLLLWLSAFPVRADPLDEILAGGGDAQAALAGLVVANGNTLGGISVAKGCARFATDGTTCADALTPQHMLRVASISKFVTALGAMKLVEQGKLSLSADVSKMLGFRLRNPNFPKSPITLAQLLSHTSSLRDSETYWAEFPQTIQSLFGAKSDHFDKDHAPGAFFTYTNLNYGVIATLIEKASGERFDRYMQRAVFKPLGITAGYNWSGVEGQSLPVGTLYRKPEQNGPWVPQVDDFAGGPPKLSVRSKVETPNLDSVRPGSNGTLFSPQGGLRISVENLAKIARLVANCGQAGGKQFLSCKTINRMAEPVWQLKPDFSNGADEDGFYQAYGLGPQRFHIDDSRELMVGHFADAYGLRGGLIVNPATRKYAIYLITGFASDPAKLKSDIPGIAKPEAALLDFLRPYIQ